MNEERTNLLINDEQPVGGKNNSFHLSEYREDYIPSDVQSERIEAPLRTRMRSKILKQRQSAYEEILQKLQDKVDYVEMTTEDFILFISDSHPPAQEKGVQIAFTYIERKVNVLNDNDAKEIVKALVEKALVQSRELVKKTGMDIVIILFEMGYKQAITDAILTFVGWKNPKIICAAIQLVGELLKQFGIKRLDYLKPYWEFIKNQSQSPQNIVKNDAMNFLKEAGKWLGNGIEPQLQTLKKAQQDEIMKFIETLPENNQMKPLRGTQEEQSKVSQKQNDYDPFDHADPVDVLQKFPDTWCEKVKATQKWAEKKDLLELLFRAIQVPKIAINNQNIYSLVQMLKGLLNDNNQAIQLMALKIVGQLALGMRKSFSQSCKIVLLNVVEKLKDSKTQIIEQVLSVLKNFFYSITLDDMIDNFKELLENKSAGTKTNSLIIIEICIESQNKQSLLKLQCLKTLPMYLISFLDDSSLEVRNKTLTLLGKIQGKVFEGSLKKEFAKVKPEKVIKINLIAKTIMDSQKENKHPQLNSSTQSVEPQQMLPTITSLQQQRVLQVQNMDAPNHQIQVQQKILQPNMHDEIPKQSVFQNKEQRIQLELKNPFNITNPSDQQIDILKQMFLVPSIPQTLIQNLFSINQNSNIKAIKFIKQHVNKANELSDILIKWVFTISWLRESVNLQSEVLEFLNFLMSQMRNKGSPVHPTECRILKGYIFMLSYLLCKTQQKIFAQRTIPLIMQILKDSPDLVDLIIADRQSAKLEDEEGVNKEILQRANSLIEQFCLRIIEWSRTNTVINRSITIALIELITGEPQKSAIEQEKIPQKILVVDHGSSQFEKKLIQSIQEVPVLVQQKQKNPQVQTVAERFLQFKDMAIQVLCNEIQMKKQGVNLMDLSISLAIAVFQTRDKDLIFDYCNELAVIMTCSDLMKTIPYEKIFDIIYWIFKQILQEVNLKENQIDIKPINSLMLKILGGSDVTNLYLSLLDIILKERSNNQNIQLLHQSIQLVSKCLNKILVYVNKKLSPQSLLMILDRFNNYLLKYCQFPDGCPPDNSRKCDDIIAKVIKTALLQFTNVNEIKEISQILDQLKICPQSHLRRWTLDRLKMDDQQNQRNSPNHLYHLPQQRYSQVRHQIQSEQQTIRLIADQINSNDENFEKSLDLLLTFMRRNKGFEWKQFVNDNHPQFTKIQQKIEQEVVSMNLNLEKRLEELTSLKETMKQ